MELNVKETLQKIKALFVEMAPPPVVPAVAPAIPVAASTDYTLLDGTAVSIDKLEIGGVLMINALPAPAGDYTLSDNTTLTVDANGVITNVALPAAPAAPALPVAAPAVPGSVQPTGANGLFSKEQIKEMSQQFAIGGTDERVARLETLCTALMENVFGWELQNAERNATAKAAIEAYAGATAAMATSGEQMSKYSEAVQGLFSVVEQLVHTPIADPLETPKDSFKNDKFQKKEDKIKEITENFAKLKKEKLNS